MFCDFYSIFGRSPDHRPQFHLHFCFHAPQRRCLEIVDPMLVKRCKFCSQNLHDGRLVRMIKWIVVDFCIIFSCFICFLFLISELISMCYEIKDLQLIQLVLYFEEIVSFQKMLKVLFTLVKAGFEMCL